MKFMKADRMCYSKRRYPSQIKAYGAIGLLQARYAESATHPWRAYECPICRGYHLTKEPQDNPEYQKRRWMMGIGVRDLTTA